MKILIVNNNMEIGGIQKSLVNLLTEISKNHEVTLMLFSPHGELMEDIPQNVKIKSGNFFTRILGMSQKKARECGIITYLLRSIFATMAKTLGVKIPFGLLTNLQKDKYGYDVAISFMQNSGYKIFYGGTGEYVINSVKANKKIAFIHCDFENYFGNNPYNIGLYKNFDSIACVSHSVKAVFDRVCPMYAQKTCTVHNMYDFTAMEQAANEDISCPKTHPFIFSSSRISSEKGILDMLPIFKRLKDKKLEFVWYIAGNGEDFDEAERQIRSLGLSENILLLGQKKNPYPYFKQADFLLVPSHNEAAPMVFAESFTFGTPVFTTDTTSAKELVESINGGWVTNRNELENNLEKVIKNRLWENIFPEFEKSNRTAAEEFENILK